MSQILMHRFFSDKKKNEIFDLELFFLADINTLQLNSSVIPRWLLEIVFLPYEDILVDAPKFKEEKVFNALSDVATELMKHPATPGCFFKKTWLDKKGRVEKRHLAYLYNSMVHFKQSQPTFVTHQQEYISFHLTSVFKKALSGVNGTNMIVKSIRRKHFESEIENESQSELYIQHYNEIKFFVEVISLGMEPSFVAGLNKAEEVVIAYVRHSKVVQL
jgi:hypothetical protein